MTYRSNRNCRERCMRSFLAPADCPWAWQRKARGLLDADRYCDYTLGFILVSTRRNRIWSSNPGPEGLDCPHILRFLAAQDVVFAGA